MDDSGDWDCDTQTQQTNKQQEILNKAQQKTNNVKVEQVLPNNIHGHDQRIGTKQEKLKQISKDQPNANDEKWLVGKVDENNKEKKKNEDIQLNPGRKQQKGQGNEKDHENKQNGEKNEVIGFDKFKKDLLSNQEHGKGEEQKINTSLWDSSLNQQNSNPFKKKKNIDTNNGEQKIVQNSALRGINSAQESGKQQNFQNGGRGRNFNNPNEKNNQFNSQGGRGSGFADRGGRGQFGAQRGNRGERNEYEDRGGSGFGDRTGGFGDRGGRGGGFGRGGGGFGGGGRGFGGGGFGGGRDGGGFGGGRGGGFGGRGRGGGFNRGDNYEDRSGGNNFGDRGGFGGGRGGGFRRDFGNNDQNGGGYHRPQQPKVYQNILDKQEQTINIAELSIIQGLQKLTQKQKISPQFRINTTMATEPLGLKCWPTISLYIKKSRVSFYLSRIHDHLCSIIYFPYSNYSMNLYPGNLVNQFPYDYRKKLKEKNKPQGQAYLQRCVGYKNFQVIAFAKISEENPDTTVKSLQSMFQQCSRSQKQKFESFIIPYSLPLGPLKGILKVAFQALQKDSDKFKQIIISTNDPKTFCKSSGEFLEIIQQLADANDLVIQ